MNTRVRSSISAIAATLLVTGLLACGEEEADTDDMDSGQAPAAAPAMNSAMPSVTIVEPADGDTIDGGTVMVRLEVSGLTLAAAGDTTPGTGHHHLFLDSDVTAAGLAIPSVPGAIVHKGDASSTHTFENVATGEHRLIAVIADGKHIPLQPWVVDTVHFVVR